jgi:hypothetical protein
VRKLQKKKHHPPKNTITKITIVWFDNINVVTQDGRRTRYSTPRPRWRPLEAGCHHILFFYCFWYCPTAAICVWLQIPQFIPHFYSLHRAYRFDVDRTWCREGRSLNHLWQFFLFLLLEFKVNQLISPLCACVVFRAGKVYWRKHDKNTIDDAGQRRSCCSCIVFDWAWF